MKASKKNKFLSVALGALMGFATYAADLVSPKKVRADMIYKVTGQPFTLEQITTIPGLGNHIEGFVTVADSTNTSRMIRATDWLDWGFSCGSLELKKSTDKIDLTSYITLSGDEVVFSDILAMNKTLPLIQIGAAGDSTIDYSGVATMIGTVNYYNLSFEPNTWQRDTGSQVPVPPSALFVGTGLLGLIAWRRKMSGENKHQPK
jgi:hypothetical protein